MIDLNELKEIKENTAKYLHRIMIEIEPCIVIELCERVIAAEAKLAEIEKQEPVFYYRPRMDDGYEGPIHAKSIEKVRIDSGVWKPLYASPVQQSPAVAVPDSYVQLAEKLIVKACCDAVEKLNEISPEQGWDSGEVVAEMYIRKLRANISTTTPAPDYKAQRDELLALIIPALDFVRCGIGGNYGGEPYNEKMDEVYYPLKEAIAKASTSNTEDGK